MRRRYTRIEIDGNKTYLRYRRGLVDVIVPIKPGEFAGGQYYNSRGRRWYSQGGIKEASDQLRDEIRAKRIEMREADKLASKPKRAVHALFRQKRERVWRQAFEVKKPASAARHVGVEIEFISSDDRSDIAKTLARHGVAPYVQLKSDGSVNGDSDSDDCDGSCRDNCECAYCDETHYCENERDCNRRARRSGDDAEWAYREDCGDCRSDGHTETLEDCDCGGTDEHGEKVCSGEHVVCIGHCSGHSCNGSDDHPYYDCNCECDCGGSESGHEIAFVAKSSQIASVITKVCAALAEHGATVNDTCGLHVHIDMRGHRDVDQAFANLVNSQQLLYSMVPKSRRDNPYCRPNISTNMADHDGRYWGINPASYSEHKTLEARLHSGTVNPAKIVNFISLLQAIAYADADLPKVTSLADFLQSVKIPAALIEYIKLRIEKFKRGQGTYSLPIGEIPTTREISADQLPLEMTIEPSYSDEFADYHHTVGPVTDAEMASA